MMTNIEIRNKALKEVKQHKIDTAAKLRVNNDPSVVVLKDDCDGLEWAWFKEGTEKYKNEIPWDYLAGLEDHCWCGRRMSDDQMVLMFKYIEAWSELVLYEITI